MSSVLSYNDLDLAPVLRNDQEEKGDDENDENDEIGQEDDQGDDEGDRHHESTFAKQLVYFLLMTFLNIG